MNTRLTALLMIAAALFVTSPARADAQLPECNSTDAISSLKEAQGNVHRLFEVKELKADDATKQRWCYAFYIGTFGMRGIYMEAVFTLEWINATEGRYWLAIKQAGESAR